MSLQGAPSTSGRKEVAGVAPDTQGEPRSGRKATVEGAASGYSHT